MPDKDEALPPTLPIPGLGPSVTLSQAAAYLGMTRQGVHHAIGRGELIGEVREVGPGGIRLTWIPVASLKTFARARRDPRPRRGRPGKGRPGGKPASGERAC
jgi:hypothetical protein